MTDKKVKEDKLRPTSKGFDNLKLSAKSPRSIKTSSTIVRSEKHKYYRDMNKFKENDNHQRAFNYDIQRNQTPMVSIFRGHTPLFGFNDKRTAMDTEQKPTTQSQLNRFDDFDGLRFSEDKYKFTTIYAHSRQRQSQLYLSGMKQEQRPPTLSRQSVSTASLIQIDNQSLSNEQLIYSPIILEQDLKVSSFKKANEKKSLLKITPKKSKQANWFDKDLNEKPRFNAVFNKHSSQKLIQIVDPLEIKKLTSKQYELYQKRKQQEAKIALEFRSKNSLVTKHYDKVCDPRSIGFCRDVLNKLDVMIAQTPIIPFSVATLGADNGLKEKVSTVYKEEINSESIDAAKKMVQQIKDRAQLAGQYQVEISEQTRDLRRQKIINTMKNAVEQLKSMNYIEDGDLEPEILELKEFLFYSVKQNQYKEALQIIDREPLLLNLMDRNKMTPLHWAVKRNFISLADQLLKRGAKRNPQDLLGRTPLHFAAKQNFFEMSKLLLRNRADLNIKNKKQLTAVEVATSEDIINLITKARRFEVISKMSFGGPSKALVEAQYRLFKMAGEESD